MGIYQGVVADLARLPAPVVPKVDQRPLQAGAYPRLQLGPFPDFLMNEAAWRELEASAKAWREAFEQGQSAAAS
eukprot:2877331-Alexandrium_andersonii.AAC.1